MDKGKSMALSGKRSRQNGLQRADRFFKADAEIYYDLHGLQKQRLMRWFGLHCWTFRM
jgi:hypothetical protein